MLKVKEWIKNKKPQEQFDVIINYTNRIALVGRIIDDRYFQVEQELTFDKGIIKILYFFEDKIHVNIKIIRFGELGGGFTEIITINKLKEDYGC